MSSDEFCYWLQGYFELRDGGGLSGDATFGPAQVKVIREHLELVFTKRYNVPSEVTPAIRHFDMNTKLC